EYSALGWFRNATKDLEKSALTGAIASDDADDRALLDIEAYVLERPEFLHFVALNDLPPAHKIESLANEVAGFTSYHVTQRRVPLTGPMTNQVTLGQLLD